MVLSLSTVNRVDELVAATQAEGRAPSLIAGVVRDGTLAHVTSAGETPAPDRDTQFRIGSITKSLTAALILGLRDEGRLTLDDPLGEHLPELAGAPAGVRLRQLLGHCAGLQREPDGDWWERSAGVGLAGLVAGVTDAKIAFPAYRRMHYSNLGYGLLGGVVERLSGTSWWQALSTRLLVPLGMQRTSYAPEDPFARGYVVHPWQDRLREEPRHDAGAMAPAGQLWSTVADLARWAAVLAYAPPGGALNAGTVLSPESVTEMATPVALSDLDGWTSGYGLGLQLWRSGERVFAGHTGSMPGYLAVVAVHRASHTGVVAFANAYSLARTPLSRLGLSLLEAVLDSEPGPPPPPWRPIGELPEAVLPLCGRWWWMGLEFEVRWDGRTGHLVLQASGSEPSRFRADGPDRWVGVSGENVGEVLCVRRHADASVADLEIATYVLSRDPLPDI